MHSSAWYQFAGAKALAVGSHPSNRFIAQTRRDLAMCHGIEMVVAALKALSAKSSLVLEQALNIIFNMMATAGLIDSCKYCTDLLLIDAHQYLQCDRDLVCG